MNANKKERKCQIFSLALGGDYLLKKTAEMLTDYLNNHPNYQIINMTMAGINNDYLIVFFEVD